MEYWSLTKIMMLVTLANTAQSLDAHSGTGSIVPRDTDRVSALRDKLTKLNDLLTLLNDGDEKDLQTAAEQKKAQLPVDVPLQSEDTMGVGRVQVPKVAPTPKQQTPAVAQKPLVPSESSIETLAKALARLQDPRVNSKDSTGDYLGTQYNEVGTSDERTREMENLISRALSRLSQNTSDRQTNRQTSVGGNLDLAQNHAGQGFRVKDQGLKLVEGRIMHDLLLAEKLGISLDDIIEDLDLSAARNAKVKTLEEELDALNLQK